MTQKRFTVMDWQVGMEISDNHTGKDYNRLSDICDLLNEQHETITRLEKENEQLKQQVDEMITIFENSGLDYHISDELNEILNR
jgi:hypothetical protein